MIKPNKTEMEHIIKLKGPVRYEYFIKRVADNKKTWGLFKDGWALAKTDANDTVFPLWPLPEYASLCAKNEWGEYEPKIISLASLSNKLLAELKKDNIKICIFSTPTDMGITPTF